MTGHVPQRVCVVCREELPKSALVGMKKQGGRRIVWPSGPQVPGRGLYVCRTSTCIGRLFTDRRLRRMYIEAMEAECVEQLGAVLSGLGEGSAAAQGSEEGRP